VDGHARTAALGGAGLLVSWEGVQAALHADEVPPQRRAAYCAWHHGPPDNVLFGRGCRGTR
jgi:hypothetical protein